MKIRNKVLAPCLALMIGSAALLPSASVLADDNTPLSGNDGSDTEKVYCIGSVSKVYVTTAVMQLVDKGLVGLDTPITEYIPNFRMADPRYTKITVRMLMNHTSGILGTQYANMELYGDNTMVSNDEFIAMLEDQKLKAEPGEYACYCNNGFELLRIIVENVSGMSYTDYVKKNISGPVCLSNTGTPMDMFGREDAAAVYSGAQPIEFEYCMAPGSGGIYATASDVAEFGSTFWKNDNRLLSQASKDNMATRWTDLDPEYLEGAGLGWDYVESISYAKQGVKVVGKGGDVGTMHAMLVVAPDNNISVSVLSSGGSSSFNGLVAEALLDVALEEQGIIIEHESGIDVIIVDSIPEEYKQYEGYYSMSSMTGSGIAQISFTGDLMTVVTQGISSKTTSVYRYTDAGGFIEVDDNDNIKPARTLVFFETGDDGKVYVKGEQIMNFPGLGSSVMRSYFGERIESAEADEDTINAWASRSLQTWVLASDIYSSSNYDDPVMRLRVSDNVPGYAIFGLSAGSRVVKMTDEDDLTFFQTIPSSTNRDLAEAHANDDGTIETTLGSVYRSVDTLPEFTPDIRSVDLKTNKASWYRIGDDMAYRMIRVERPENSTIYVYNKYFEPLYSTHVLGASDQIDLPEGGYILFLGEDGGVVDIK